MKTTAIQVWAKTLLCQFCGVQPIRKMTFGIAGARVLCDDCAKPHRDLMLNPPKPAAVSDDMQDA